MYVKYNENGDIISAFIKCVPDDISGFLEIPDDDAVVREFIKKNKPQDYPQQSAEERIAALEEQLAAAKILLGVE